MILVDISAPASPPDGGSAMEIIEDYRRRWTPATPTEILTWLDGWDAGAFVSHWMRQNDPEQQPSFTRITTS